MKNKKRVLQRLKSLLGEQPEYYNKTQYDIWENKVSQYLNKLFGSEIRKDFLDVNRDDCRMKSQSQEMTLKILMDSLEELRPMHKVLFLSANPKDTESLRLDEEIREIQLRIKGAGSIELTPRFAVQTPDIIEALIESKANVVHFSGHGTRRGSICIENKEGKTKYVDSAALSALFKEFKEQVKCVVLNACYSSIQANAISEHIENVIGIDHSIDDEAAISYSSGFYIALSNGMGYEKAHNIGCVSMGLDFLSHPKPVLIKKV